MLHKYIVKFWQQKSILNYALLPFSLIFVLLGALRNIFYFFKKTYVSSKFIICVGNATIGGGGKTPTTIAIAKYLIQNNLKVVVLTKGYKGSIVNSTFFNINEINNPKESGDEAVLLNKICAVVVSKNWVNGLKLIDTLIYKKQIECDVIITDDGYQNNSFYKNYNILVLDSNYRFGNNLIFPAGPLRDFYNKALKKADSVVLVNYSNNNIGSFNINKNITFTANIVYSYNKSILNNNFIAFCGLANPNKFYYSLINNGFNIKEFIVFKDHYSYKDNDIVNLLNKAKKLNCLLITTEKDLVKISPSYYNNIFTLDIKINLPELLLLEILNKYNNFIARSF